MLDLVQDLSRQELIIVDDAALVTWQEGKRKPETKYLKNLTGPAALCGASWGLLFGLILYLPFLGMAVGAAIGALVGHFTPDDGIDRDLIEAAQEKVTEGTSALFLVTGGAVQARVMDAVQNSGLKFDLVYTNLSKKKEQQLRKDLALLANPRTGPARP
jgi:uncharacterized membrane protein